MEDAERLCISSGCSDWMSEMPFAFWDTPLWNLAIPGTSTASDYFDVLILFCNELMTPLLQPFKNFDIRLLFFRKSWHHDLLFRWAVVSSQVFADGVASVGHCTSLYRSALYNQMGDNTGMTDDHDVILCCSKVVWILFLQWNTKGCISD